MQKIILLIFFLTSLFAQYEIDGRWHLVGYEDNVMYQFEDNYRYSIYSIDGTFGGLEDAGGSPNPYTLEEDIITIDLFFGTIVNYQMNFMCDGQVVEFTNIDYGTIHSTHFREGYGYQESPCNSSTLDDGDLNDDGNIDVLDVIILVNHILSSATVELDGADINDDGQVNILDIVQLVNIILGIAANTVSDIDGNIYEIIQIGDQLWMAENLKVTHYNNGDSVTYITREEPWGSMDEGQYGVYDDEPTNANIYGNIYNWAVIGDIRGICPVDWHVPSDNEYTLLTDFLGGEFVAGGKMKEAGLEHWNYNSDQISLEATNESGFTGLPAGHRNTNSGDYIYMGFYGYFWSSTENGSDLAWRRYLFHYSSGVARDTFGKPNGFSIRCLSD